jgi:hypothetical protein
MLVEHEADFLGGRDPTARPIAMQVIGSNRRSEWHKRKQDGNLTTANPVITPAVCQNMLSSQSLNGNLKFCTGLVREFHSCPMSTSRLRPLTQL